jgi:hypothetical protein
MLSILLKALEMLMAALKATPDQKRQAVAKDILRIYLDLEDLIGRGRKILSLLSTSSLAHRGVSISLLMQQHQVLQSLSERLSNGPVNYVMALHLPRVCSGLLCLLSAKRGVAWSTLDQLVSDNEPLTPEEWVSRLSARMDSEDVSPDDSPNDLFVSVTGEVVLVDEIPVQMRPWTPIESSADLAPSPELILVASAEEIRTAEAVLDAIADASEQLRAFLTERFKLEDVL